MKPIEELGISPTPWQLVPYGPSTMSTVATHGDIETADGRSFFPNGEFPEIQDARLIAAAPKLYEALREAVIEMCHPCESCSGHPDYSCKDKESHCFVKKWRAALAEAAGEVSNG